MRPVERGLAPQIYAQYGDAIEDLKSRLGSYCSYCERQVAASLAVEHVIPKNLHPELEIEWNNFLLGCTNCNSVKSDREVEIDNFIWPDRDNTLLAFVYSKGGFVRLADNLNNEQKTKAQSLLDLVGLQRHPAQGWVKPARKDKRWQDREESWATAEKCRDLFENLEQADAARDLVLEVAKSNGFFSVWMTVFNDYPDIKRELIKLFLGTAISCFDPDGKPIDRPNLII
jgi:uncharacterized protein (TIGR02646 family)